MREAGFGIILEITEHTRVDDYPALRAAVASIGENVRLAVDDAGPDSRRSATSSNLRPALVKLDAGLVRGVDADPVRQALVAGMAHFAERMDTRLVAEGVETQAERSTLLELSVTFAQGYLFGRPVPVRDLPTRA